MVRFSRLQKGEERWAHLLLVHVRAPELDTGPRSLASRVCFVVAHQLAQAMIVRREQRPRPVHVDEVLERGVGDREAIERRGAAPELVEEDLEVLRQRAFRVEAG